MPSWAPFITTISGAMSRYTSRRNGRLERSMTPADLGSRMRAVSDAHRHGSYNARSQRTSVGVSSRGSSAITHHVPLDDPVEAVEQLGHRHHELGPVSYTH